MRGRGPARRTIRLVGGQRALGLEIAIPVGGEKWAALSLRTAMVELVGPMRIAPTSELFTSPRRQRIASKRRASAPCSPPQLT
jgi:hypothetical protein